MVQKGALKPLRRPPFCDDENYERLWAHWQILITSHSGNLRQLFKNLWDCKPPLEAILSALVVMKAYPTPGVQDAINGETSCRAPRRRKIASPNAHTGNVRRFFPFGMCLLSCVGMASDTRGLLVQPSSACLAEVTNLPLDLCLTAHTSPYSKKTCF
jgi:hypothetical protein